MPVGVATFVGRQHERATLVELLSRGRLVTLTGAGGCGKTRLAVEVAGELAPRFADGTHWIDLQALEDPDRVLTAVASAVDVQEQSRGARDPTLVDALGSRHALVVLDSCEHLVEACAELVTSLLTACPRLHVLATSRVPLAVGGEATFELAGLPTPPPGASTPGVVAAADAARLFALRACQVVPDFRIDDHNAAAVTEVCRRLDGVPLAIELAAARLRTLAPHQIAEALSARFELLTTGPRGAPARQQTLEASLDWSFRLLEDVQQLALARLSVFAGSFELDAAASVVGGDARGGEVLDVVTALVESSLLTVTTRRRRARYRMLETVRAYARQRLVELEDPDGARGRHLAFHVQLAQEAGRTGALEAPWVDRLAADLDDLRAAMDWASRTGDVPSLVNLTRPIVRFWFGRGLSGEVHRRLHDAVAAPGTTDLERATGLVTAAALAGDGGAYARAHRSANQAVTAARAAGDEASLSIALGLRSWMGVITGGSPSDRATADAEEAIRVAERCTDASSRAFALQLAGAGLLHSRSIDAGTRLVERALDVCESHGLDFQLPAVHVGLGHWQVWRGDLDRSTRHARRAVVLGRQVARPGWEAVGLCTLGAVAVLRGHHEVARRRLAQVATVLDEHDLQGSQYELSLLPWVALAGYASGDLRTARSTAETLERRGRAGGSRWDEAVGAWLLGLVADAEAGPDDAARAHHEHARRVASDPRLALPLGRSALALAARADDDLDGRWQRAHDGLEALHTWGDRIGTAEALETIGALAAAVDDPERSLRLLAAAAAFHARTGIVRLPHAADAARSARATAWAALGNTDAAARWEEGSNLSLVDAVSYARRGRGERRRPPVGWDSLTPAELDVVRLVAAGHTNAEIGDRLFVSVNTVKKHLSRVYAKVDVGGRADLVAQVARRDL